MDLPVIPTPIFPRWIWMEEVTFSHIPIATIITAFMTLAPILEYVGYRKRDLRFDRLSKSLTYFSLIIFSPGAALGTGIPMFIIGLYPEFWSRWANLFFWPLIIQFCLFTLEVIFLFFFYYLPWDRMMHRKRRHILWGCVAALFGLLIQAVWDGIGGYMLTPSAPLPAVDQPVGWSAQGFFNPSFPFLFSHRFFGNISYTMLLAGGVFALKFLRAKVPKEKSYFGFASDLTFSLGFLAFFAMPFIGWGYARILQINAPVAFHAIMGGHTSYYLNIKLGLIAGFIPISATYLFIRHRQKLFLLGGVTAALASLYLVLYLHPPLPWLGSPLTWRLVTTLGLAGFILFLWLMRWKGERLRLPGWQWLLFAAGLAATLAFAMGGNIRERAKSPYTVYKEIEKPEVLPYEADRFLVYEKCMACHHNSPRDLALGERETWAQRIAIERRRPGLKLTDEEATRIIGYLREHSP